jgi:hypothetical protein
MSRLQIHLSPAETARPGLPFRLVSPVGRFVRITLLRFLASVFAAEIRLGNWLIAPDQQPKLRHAEATDTPSRGAIASSRLHDPECPDFGMLTPTRLAHPAKALRIGLSRCVLYPPCKFRRSKGRLSIKFPSRLSF